MSASRAVVLVVAVLSVVLSGCRGTEHERVPPNVILISADTLRADRLGAYGYSARKTSPHVDALAEDGLLFEVHIAASPWTTPSHLSLLTGLTPTRHGMLSHFGRLTRGLNGEIPIERLSERVATLADVLAEHGWSTAAFTGGNTLNPRLGFDQGFELYDTSMVKLDDASVGRMLHWIDGRNKRPFFLFWHTFEVHAPYLDGRFLEDVLPPQRARPVAERLERIARRPGWKQVEWGVRALKRHDAFRQDVVEALYDGGIASFDGRLGELVDGLRRRHLYDPTLFVLTSDHGEQLGDRERPSKAGGKNFYGVHGHTVYEELIRIPLILKLPHQAHRGRRVPELTGSIDVMPSIVDVLGLPIPAAVEGRSLRPLWDGGTWPAREVLSEALARDDEKKSLRGERYKYIVSVDSDTVAARGRSYVPPDAPAALFDLLNDPGEREDLLSNTADPAAAWRACAMAEELRRHLSVVGRPDRAQLDAEALEGLKALGYVE